LDAFGRSRYNNLGGDDIDFELAAFLVACWEFNSNKEIMNIPLALRSEIYKLFIDKARTYKEEVEDHLKNQEGIPEFILNEYVYTKDDKLHIDFRGTLKQGEYEDVTGRFFHSKSDLNIYRPIEEAIMVAKSIKLKFSKDDLGLVLYTGGASNMRGVQSALKSYFKPIPTLSISEEDACNTVALGAAYCRYEEVYGKKKIIMRNRLLESVLTRQAGGKNYSTIVPLTTEPCDRYIKLEKKFKLERPTIKLRLPLFRGVNPLDHQIAPIRDFSISLNRVIDRGTEYQIEYRMTQNKTIEMKVVFDLPGSPIEATAILDMWNQRSRDSLDIQLCTVNPM
jgi:hypothetical protein